MQPFNPQFIGNEPVVRYLDKALQEKRLHHAYCFMGPPSVGKFTLANAFARAILCKKEGEVVPCGHCDPCKAGDAHPDRITLGGDGNSISIAQTREFRASLGLSSFMNSYRIGMIRDAENVTREAQHALLKTLEEPLPHVVLMITSNGPLLPTMVSRVQMLTMKLTPAKTMAKALVVHGADKEQAQELAQWADGRPGDALLYYGDAERLSRLKEEQSFAQKLLDRAITFDEIGEYLDGDLETARERIRSLEPVVSRILRDRLLDTVKTGHSSYRTVTKLAQWKAGLNALEANVDPRLILENFYLA